MRQKSQEHRDARARARARRSTPRAPARLVRRHRARPRQPRPRARLRLRRPRPDRAQRRRPARATPPPTLARRASPRARARATPQLLRGRHGRGQQHDLRAPPRAVLVALGLVRDQARGLQIIQPALHAAAMRAHEPRPLGAAARDAAPAHHRRQPRHQLLDRAREPPRPRRVPEPEQVALDRVRARLQPIVTRRRTAPRPPRPAQQRGHDQPARLGRDRRASPGDTSDDALDGEKQMRAPAAPPAPAGARHHAHATAASRRSRRS